jgi:serine/threonine protein kinase
LTEREWDLLHDLADTVEKALESADTVDLTGFLPADVTPSLRRVILQELIKTEMEIRCRRKQATTLDQYVERYPELGGLAALPAHLIYWEYHVRHCYGDQPTLESYQQRFPGQFAQLEQLLRQQPLPTLYETAGLKTLQKPVPVLPTQPHRPPPPPPPPTKVPDETHSDPDPHVLQVGGGYRLLERIGRGQFGEVFKAEAPGGISVAIKRIYRSLDDDTSKKELKALEVIKQLHHPFLLQTQAFWVRDDHLLIVMELAEGSVKNWAEECKLAGLPGIPAADLLDYFAEAAEALDFLHTNKINKVLHRDVKPENLLRLNGHAKVADFGLAKEQETDLATGTICGTPAYMAPEMWKGQVSVHSDQYSLAVTYVELRLGRRPFTGQNLFEIARMHDQGTPDLAPLEAAEQCVLQRALAKDPEKRWPTCEAFIDALKRAVLPPSPVAVAAPKGTLRSLRPPGSREVPVARPRPESVGDAPTPRLGDWKGKPRGKPPRPARPQPSASDGPIWRHTDVSFPARVTVGKVVKLRVRLVPAEEPSPTGGVKPLPRPHAHDTSMSIEVPRLANPGERLPPIRLTVSVAAENFVVEGEARADLVVPLTGKSPAVYFRLRGLKPGPGRIMVDFTQGGRPVGSMDLYPEVMGKPVRTTPLLVTWPALFALSALIGAFGASMAAAEPSDGRPGAPEYAPPSADGLLRFSVVVCLLSGLFMLLYMLLRLCSREASRVEGEQWLALSVHPPEPPDVVVKVFELRYAGGPGHLKFHLYSTHPKLQDLPVLDGDLGSQDLKADLAAWIESQLRTLGSVACRPGATAAEADRALADLGYQLYEQLLPPKLQEVYWVLRERGVRTVLVLSDEPHIPWELVRPYRTDPDSGRLEGEGAYQFWGEAFALTHWLRGRPPAHRFSLQHVLAMAAGGTGATEPPARPVRDMVAVAHETAALPEPDPLRGALELGLADKELAVLRSLESAGVGVNVRVLPARRRNLSEALERGGFDLLHLACHGRFGGPDAADASCVLLEDGVFSAAELSPRLAGPLRAAAPLVFLNACHTGRLGFSLTRLGSWGARLVQLGCGGFVGTLWPVTDRAALAFAGSFYEAAVRGLPLGEAVRAARQRVHRDYPNDPSWMAYCCFADPQARVGRSATTPPVPPASAAGVEG